LLGDQAGLAVDRAFQECRVAGCPAGDVGQQARDLLGAFDGAQRCGGQAAAVGVGRPAFSGQQNLKLFHAASCRFRYSSWTSCGVR
jgi:hypothetical protein